MVKEIEKEEFENRWAYDSNYDGYGRFFSDNVINNMTKNKLFKNMKQNIISLEKKYNIDFLFHCKFEERYDGNGKAFFILFKCNDNDNDIKNELEYVLSSYSDEKQYKKITKQDKVEIECEREKRCFLGHVLGNSPNNVCDKNSCNCKLFK